MSRWIHGHLKSNCLSSEFIVELHTFDRSEKPKVTRWSMTSWKSLNLKHRPGQHVITDRICTELGNKFQSIRLATANKLNSSTNTMLVISQHLFINYYIRSMEGVMPWKLWDRFETGFLLHKQLMKYKRNFEQFVVSTNSRLLTTI